MSRAGRKTVSRSSHGEWSPAPRRPDPLGLLQAQDGGRLEHLLPIKYGRMLESPFAFLRGSAVVMASDLSTTPATEIQVMLCGDAHLSNFGVFATPERSLVFDINDFDEAYPGPWEWDLKSLSTSAVVAGRGNRFSDKVCRQMASAVVEAYQVATERFAAMHTLDVWYFHVDADRALRVFETSSKKGRKSARRLVEKARSRTHQQTLEKFTEVNSGQRRIINNSPLLVPLREMAFDQVLGESATDQLTKGVVDSAWQQYLESLPDERRYLLQRFRLADAALRVGVGSVGTHCSIVLLEGTDSDDALLLQLKEAGPSVLECYSDTKRSVGSAQRVVTGQRLMQATSDIFLGWHSSGLSDRDFYWRQLKDMKGSANVEKAGRGWIQDLRPAVQLVPGPRSCQNRRRGRHPGVYRQERHVFPGYRGFRRRLRRPDRAGLPGVGGRGRIW